MYVLDDRFSTLVAFIDGYNTAFDGVPLNGFQEWTSQRILGGPSGVHWSYVIASARMPEIIDTKMRIDQIPSSIEIALVGDLLDLVDGFLDRTIDGES